MNSTDIITKENVTKDLFIFYRRARKNKHKARPVLPFFGVILGAFSEIFAACTANNLLKHSL
jgi:hypothetical protein